MEFARLNLRLALIDVIHREASNAPVGVRSAFIHVFHLFSRTVMTPTPPTQGSAPTFEQTLHRVYCEFLEMPGLQLTRRQAQRLWGLDEQLCLQLLESLVEAKFLHRSGDDVYARLTDGRAEVLHVRMAKAHVAATSARMKQSA
jgi:hypothetical protein